MLAPMRILLATLAAALLAFTLANPVTILYFTDLHEIAPVDGGARGGVARLATVIEDVRSQNPDTIVIFGGDLVGGTLFGEFQGAPLIEALNLIGIDYANFGQHEFDFGAEVARQRVNESEFQWLTANLVEEGTDDAFMGLPTSAMHEVGGLKLGIIGTTTAMDTTNAFGQVDERAVIPAVEREVERLRALGADLIIAITQQTVGEDRALRDAVPDVDLILSEEQSETATFMEVVGQRAIAKPAGNITSVVQVDIDLSRHPVLSLRAIPVDASVTETPALAELAAHYTQLLDQRLGEAVGVSSVDLNAGATLNRVGETVLGNLIADAFRASLGADLGLMQGGGIRSDRVYPAGNLSLRDLTEILPFGNTVVLVEVTGKQLLDALENGVSQVEAASGRFPHPSGFTYTFDSSRAPMQRVTEVLVAGQPLDLGATYTLATGSFIAAGGDGYSALANSRQIVDATNGKRDVLTLVDHVRALGTVAMELEGRISDVAP